MIQLEEAIELPTAHEEILRFVQRRLDRLEPTREAANSRAVIPRKVSRSKTARRP
jgi:hypothetical protein